jgi:hypothetical protein
MARAWSPAFHRHHPMVPDGIMYPSRWNEEINLAVCDRVTKLNVNRPSRPSQNNHPLKFWCRWVPALVAVLIEHAEGDTILRKKLRLLLAGTKGPGKLAAELGKRIQTIADPVPLLTGTGASRSYRNWTISEQRSAPRWRHRAQPSQSNAFGISLVSPIRFSSGQAMAWAKSRTCPGKRWPIWAG